MGEGVSRKKTASSKCFCWAPKILELIQIVLYYKRNYLAHPPRVWNGGEVWKIVAVVADIQPNALIRYHQDLGLVGFIKSKQRAGEVGISE